MSTKKGEIYGIIAEFEHPALLWMQGRKSGRRVHKI